MRMDSSLAPRALGSILRLSPKDEWRRFGIPYSEARGVPVDGNTELALLSS